MFEGVLNMPLLQNKTGVRCAERTLDAATWNKDVRDMFWNISMILGNVRFRWLFFFWILLGYLLPVIFNLFQKWNIRNFGSQFRSIFRTFSNIQDGGYYKNSEWFFVFDYFCKKLQIRCLTIYVMCRGGTFITNKMLHIQRRIQGSWKHLRWSYRFLILVNR